MAKKRKRTEAGTRGAAKFAGAIALRRPEGGRSEAIGNESRVVLSIAEILLTHLPETGERSEIQVDVGARTTAKSGAAVATTWSSGVHYYVKPGSRLNLADVVVFDGAVHQHLSLDVHITERESPRMGPEAAAAVAESAAEAAAKLAGASGALATALGAFPELVGGILRLGGDDQVLRYGVSWFTRDVRRPAEPTSYLIEGRYVIEKRRVAGQGVPAVSVAIDVSVVG